MGWISLKSLFYNFSHESDECSTQLDDWNKKFEEDYLKSCVDRYRDHCHYPEMLDLIKVDSKCLDEFSGNDLTPKEADLIKHVLNKGDETFWLDWKLWQPRAKMFAQIGMDKIRRLGFLRRTDLNDASRAFESFYQENTQHLFFEECSDLYRNSLDSWRRTAFLPITGEIFRKNGGGNAPKNSTENNLTPNINSLPLRLSLIFGTVGLFALGLSVFLLKRKIPIALSPAIPLKPLERISEASQNVVTIGKAALWLVGGFGSSWMIHQE